MKKDIINKDKERGIVQITTFDERWYARPTEDPITKLPRFEFVPSVTWIADHYPKGVGFYKWLANKGWDEAEAIKSAAGDKGSKVHLAIADLIRGLEAPMKYAAIVMLETDLTPQNIVEEICSNLEFDSAKNNTVVHSIVVLTDDATEVANYERKKE
jgi:hypothetical protein